MLAVATDSILTGSVEVRLQLSVWFLNGSRVDDPEVDESITDRFESCGLIEGVVSAGVGKGVTVDPEGQPLVSGAD